MKDGFEPSWRPSEARMVHGVGETEVRMDEVGARNSPQ